MTSVARTYAAVWAFGFGAVTGMVAGTAIRFPGIAWNMPFTLATALVGWVVSYAVIRRTSDRWQAGTLYLRMALYFITVFVCATAAIQALWLVFGSATPLTVVAQTLATAGAVAAGLWLTFYGGIERVIDAIMDRL